MDPESLNSCPVDVEEAIAFLRQSDCSIIDTIKYLKNELGLSLADAKQRVHLSETWADVRLANDDFHDALEAAVKEMAGGGPE